MDMDKMVAINGFFADTIDEKTFALTLRKAMHLIKRSAFQDEENQYILKELFNIDYQLNAFAETLDPMLNLF